MYRGYVSGTVLILAGLLAGEISAIDHGRGQDRASHRVSYRRSPRSFDEFGSAADGGEDDEDLDFLLDDEK